MPSHINDHLAPSPQDSAAHERLDQIIELLSDIRGQLAHLIESIPANSPAAPVEAAADAAPPKPSV
jgi:hypothetical protein